MAATQITGATPGQGFPPKPTSHAVTIPNAARIPVDGVDLGGWSLCGLLMDALFDGTATIGFTVSTDDATYVDMYDYTGTIISVTCGVSRYIPVDPALFVGVRYIKPNTGSAQTGACVITLVVRPIA